MTYEIKGFCGQVETTIINMNLSFSKNTMANQHVVRHSSGWAVKKAGAEKASSVHKTQKEAINKAKSIAKTQKSELFIHGKDGKIRERNTYGKDPFPPKN